MLLVLIMVGLLMLTGVLPAEATSIYSIDFDGEVGYTEYKDVSLSNIISVTVKTKSSVASVTINGESAQEHGGGYWVLYDVSLKPGDNTLQVVTEGEKKGDSSTETRHVYYLDDNIPGSKYIISDFSIAKGRLELFGGAFKLELPDKHVVLHNDQVATDQKVNFSVTKPHFKPSPGITYMSNIFSFTASASNRGCSLTAGPTLTLSYEPAVSQTEAHLLTVLRMEPYYSVGMGFPVGIARNLGGVVDTEAQTITVPLPRDAFGHYVVVKMTGDFRDFYRQDGKQSRVAWSRPYVLTLWAKGVMSPLEKYPDGTPVPSGYFGLLAQDNDEMPITRKEMASVLVKALHLPLVSPKDVLINPTYSDLQGVPVYDCILIETATRFGLFSGIPGKSGGLEFRPDAFVTRQQAAAILSRAAEAELADPFTAKIIIKRYFESDYEKMDDWAYPYVLAALQQGLMQVPEPGSFYPDKSFSRAEAARVAYILLKRNNYL